VGRFFDDVHVMAEDARVRGNRLALLKRTSRSSIASRTFPVSEVLVSQYVFFFGGGKRTGTRT